MGADRSERPGRRAGIFRRLFSSLPSRRCFNAVRFDGHLSSGLSPHDEAHKETTDPLPSYCQFGGGFRARLHRDVNSGPDGSVQSANSAVVRRIKAEEFSGVESVGEADAPRGGTAVPDLRRNGVQMIR